jgi:hypothetical protein
MNNEQQQSHTFILIVIMIVALGLLASMTSCRTTGYGCPGQGSGLGYVGYK